jgi:hypothetical protein
MLALCECASVLLCADDEGLLLCAHLICCSALIPSRRSASTREEMADLSSFSALHFLPDQWINAAVREKGEEDALEAYLTQLAMKLHMLSQDYTDQLETGRHVGGYCCVSAAYVHHDNRNVGCDECYAQNTIGIVPHRDVVASDR